MISLKRVLALLFIFIFGPIITIFAATYLMSVTHHFFDFPKDIEKFRWWAFMTLILAYPITAIITVPCANYCENNFIPYIPFGMASGIILGLFFSPLSWAAEDAVTWLFFPYLGICYGLVISSLVAFAKRYLLK